MEWWSKQLRAPLVRTLSAPCPCLWCRAWKPPPRPAPPASPWEGRGARLEEGEGTCSFLAVLIFPALLLHPGRGGASCSSSRIQFSVFPALAGAASSQAPWRCRHQPGDAPPPVLTLHSQGRRARRAGSAPAPGPQHGPSEPLTRAHVRLVGPWDTLVFSLVFLISGQYFFTLLNL